MDKCPLLAAVDNCTALRKVSYLVQVACRSEEEERLRLKSLTAVVENVPESCKEVELYADSRHYYKMVERFDLTQEWEWISLKRAFDVKRGIRQVTIGTIEEKKGRPGIQGKKEERDWNNGELDNVHVI